MLSSQQIIDCSIAYGNLGCSGGSLKNTLQYLQRVGGIMQGIEYPYKAKVCTSFFSHGNSFNFFNNIGNTSNNVVGKCFKLEKLISGVAIETGKLTNIVVKKWIFGYISSSQLSRASNPFLISNKSRVANFNFYIFSSAIVLFLSNCGGI